MNNKQSRFRRRKPSLKYRRRYFLVCEGEVTEPSYFNQLKNLYRDSIIDIVQLKEKQPAPTYLIKRANKAEPDLKSGDELWIILDTDKWTKEHFEELERWAHQRDSRNVAISKPCFEIWLVFHEQNPKDCGKRACQTYFQQNIAHGAKEIRSNWLTSEKLKNAVTRAKDRDRNNYGFVPDTPTSRVYRLIENIDHFCKTYV